MNSAAGVATSCLCLNVDKTKKIKTKVCVSLNEYEFIGLEQVLFMSHHPLDKY